MATMRAILVVWLGSLACVLTTADAHAADWPRWGGTTDANMVSAETGLPDLRPSAGEATTRISSPESPHVKWNVRLGGTTWGNATVADGRVFVGTAGPDRKGGAVKCFDEATASLRWQLVSPMRKFAFQSAQEIKNILK